MTLRRPRSVISAPFERSVLWIVQSRWRMVGVSVLLGIGTFLAECVIHVLVVGKPDIKSAVTDAIILGCLSTLFTILVLMGARDRHRKVQDDMRRIAELNHRIRNALQVIVYGAASQVDNDGQTAVLDGVNKIDATLKEMFPLLGERREDRPWETYNKLQLKRRNINLPSKDRRNPLA